MRNDENPLDALREGWSLYGTRLDKALDGCPPPEFHFRHGGRRPDLSLATVMIVAWMLVTVAALRYIPSAEANNIRGALACEPDAAVVCVQSILEAV